MMQKCLAMCAGLGLSSETVSVYDLEVIIDYGQYAIKVN